MLLNTIIGLCIFLYLLVGFTPAINKAIQQGSPYGSVFMFYWTLCFYPFMKSTYNFSANMSHLN